MYSRLPNVAVLALVLLSSTSSFGLSRDYQWRYGGQTHALRVNFDVSTYEHYANKPRTNLPRSYNADYAHYASSSISSGYISQLAAKLKQMADARGLSTFQLTQFITSFVQSLEYQTDQCLEYPKYPIETLVDKGGDCEDTAILLVALLENLGIDCVLLSPPGHMAAGIATDDPDANVSSPSLDSDYYYVETTGPGFAIGEVPGSYANRAITVYEVGKTDASVERPKPQMAQRQPEQECVCPAPDGNSNVIYRTVTTTYTVSGTTYEIQENVTITYEYTDW